MKKFHLILLAVSIVVSGFAKSATTVTGKVFDAKKSPVEFANAILIQAKDSSVAKGGLTDESGSFSFNDVASGSYMVLISQIGNKYYSEPFEVGDVSTQVRVKDIELPENALTLQEANVSAQKPFIEHQLDKTIVNVENSIINAGGTVLEILKRSPGVTIDNDGNIHLSGKQGVLVMMDGKPTYLSAKDLYDFLRNTPSDQLSQIEIITNPSAKYDASGNSGIINLKMRKKQNLGLNGSTRISYGQGVYPDFGTGTNLNFRNEKINLFGGFDYTRGFYFERVENIRHFSETSYTSTFGQHTFDKGDYDAENFRAGADYYISKKHIVGVLFRGNFFNNYDHTTAITAIKNVSDISDSGYVTKNNNDSKWHNFAGNLNYVFKMDTTGRELSVDADYARYDNSSDFRFETNHYYGNGSPGYDEFATDKQPATIDVRSFKVDYSQPVLKSMKLEAGVKTSLVTTDNDVRYYNYYNQVPVVDTGKTNHFKYNENINAAYLNWSGQFNKISVQIGLRGEQTVADGKQYAVNSAFDFNYVQLFPSAFFDYTFNEKNMVHLSYSRRIDRPAYQQLNPFRYFLDPYNYMEGNPNLGPQLTNAFEWSYTFNKLYTIALNYNHTSDAMTQITKQVDSTRTTFVTTENLDAKNNYGVTLTIPLHPANWWESSNNFNIYNNQFSGVSSAGNVNKRLTSFTFNSFNSFMLPHGWSAELSGYYNSRAVWGTWLVDPQVSVSAGFGKHFYKDRLQLRINVNDIFHSDILNSVIQYQNINMSFNRVYDSQFVRFHLNYSFGKKTVARARQHATSSEDEINRIKTGK